MILLDTHTWLWWVQGSASLPKNALDRIQSADVVAVASVSCLEVAWLAKKGRIVLPGTVEQFFDEALGKAGLQRNDPALFQRMVAMGLVDERLNDDIPF